MRCCESSHAWATPQEGRRIARIRSLQRNVARFAQAQPGVAREAEALIESARQVQEQLEGRLAAIRADLTQALQGGRSLATSGGIGLASQSTSPKVTPSPGVQVAGPAGTSSTAGGWIVSRRSCGGVRRTASLTTYARVAADDRYTARQVQEALIDHDITARSSNG